MTFDPVFRYCVSKVACVHPCARLRERLPSPHALRQPPTRRIRSNHASIQFLALVPRGTFLKRGSPLFHVERYLPIQNRLNISPSRSSAANTPWIFPSSAPASRRSSATSSTGPVCLLAASIC